MSDISDKEIFLYSYGLCHALARALHIRTGWPVVAFTEQKEGPYGPWSPFHIAVESPCGRIVDINGIHTLSEITEIFGDEFPEEWNYVRNLDMYYIEAAMNEDEDLPHLTIQDMREAESVADRILVSLDEHRVHRM